MSQMKVVELNKLLALKNETIIEQREKLKEIFSEHDDLSISSRKQYSDIKRQKTTKVSRITPGRSKVNHCTHREKL